MTENLEKTEARQARSAFWTSRVLMISVTAAAVILAIVLLVVG